MRSDAVIHVVDGDPAAVESVRRDLGFMGKITVNSYSSVDECLPALLSGTKDIVILFATGNPEATLAALRSIRSVDAAVPVIVRGAFTADQIIECFASGATEIADTACERSLFIAAAAVVARRRDNDRASRSVPQVPDLATILDAMPVGIHVMDAAGALTPVNEAARQLLPSIREDGRPGSGIRAWWHDTGKKVRGDEWSGPRALREGVPVTGDVIDVEGADGCRRTMLSLATPVKDATGTVTAVVIVHEDVTDLKKIEEHVIQSHKMESVGLLAGGVAHDFNNLLTAINGYSQLIQESIAEDDELLSSSIEQVLAAGRRASELTQKLLAFSRRQPLTLGSLKIDDAVSTAGSNLSRLVPKNVALTTSLGSTGVRVMADAAQLDQVLVNLVMNACEAIGSEQGAIRVTTREEVLSDAEVRRLGLEKGGAYAVISVTDNGKGIDEKTLKRIFEPFFTTKDTSRGTGLGLSIIYGIVRQHNGAITVDSTVGKGSAFHVYLPVVRAKTKRAGIPQQLIPFGGEERILLAEDDQIVRDYLSTILSQSGYSVVTASDGREAEVRFRENADNISLVITDVVMPEKNGREIHEEIKKMRPQTKIIYISGYTADIINRKGIVDRNIDFLMKPVCRTDFLQKVREVLDRP